jgi:hypothetical protein
LLRGLFFPAGGRPGAFRLGCFFWEVCIPAFVSPERASPFLILGVFTLPTILADITRRR